MQYIALLLLVANIALFGYHFMFGPQARFSPAVNAPGLAQSGPGEAAQDSALRLVTEVDPTDLEPRSGG